MSRPDPSDERVDRLIESLTAKLAANKPLLSQVLDGHGKGAITIKAYGWGSGFDIQLNITI